MKEKKSMNQEVRVTLCEKEQEDYLCFEFEQDLVEVNLNKVNGQQNLKNVFSIILRLLEKEDVLLNLEIEEGYKKGLYKEVCAEYIADLNNEIAQVKQEMMKL